MPRSGAALVAVGGYGRRELVAGQRPRRPAARPPGLRDVRRRRARGPDLVPGLGLRRPARPLRPHARRGATLAADDLRVLLGLLDVRHVAGDVGLTEALRASVLADWRGFCQQAAARAARVAAGNAASAPASWPSRSSPTSRSPAAGCATSSCSAPSPPPGSPTRRTPAWTRRTTPCSTSATPSTRSPAGPPTGSCCRSRTPSRTTSALLDADQLLRQVASSGRDRRLRARRDLAPGRACGAHPSWPQPVRHRTAAALDGAAAGSARRGGRRAGRRGRARAGRPPQDDPALVLRAAAAAAQVGLRLAPHTVDAAGSRDRAARSSRGRPRPATRSCRLLGAGSARDPGVGGARPGRAHHPAASPTGTGCAAAAAQRRPPVHRRPAPGRDRRRSAAAFTRRVARPDLLLVGALLHDIGKGWPGRPHRGRGGCRRRPALRVSASTPQTPRPWSRSCATTCCCRTPRPAATSTTRRRSTSVAAAVGSADTLDLLHALTEADALATGPAAWGEWKAGARRRPGRPDALVLRGHDVAPPAQLTDDQLSAGGQRRPRGHARSRRRTAWRSRSPLPTGSACSPRRRRARLHRLAVRSAHHAVGRGAGGAGLDSASRVRLRAGRRGAARGRAQGARRVARRRRPARRARRRTPPAQRSGRAVAPPRVDVVAGASDTATVLEVRAHDRPGLLHRIGAALAAPGSTSVGPCQHAGSRGASTCSTSSAPTAHRSRPSGLVEVARSRVRGRPAAEPRIPLGSRSRVRHALRPPRRDAQEPPRQGPAVRGGHRRHLPRDPHRAARGRRRAARRPRVRRAGQGARRRRRGLPGAQPRAAGHQDRRRGARPRSSAARPGGCASPRSRRP